MKSLVTGGAGFIGSNLALYLASLGHEVTFLDNLSSGAENNVKASSGEFIRGDVSNPQTTEGLIGQFEGIFHQAAITDPRYPDAAETLQQNVQGFRQMLELVQKSCVKLVYASTASLYRNGPAPQTEGQPKEMLSAYAQSKLIMDEMACPSVCAISPLSGRERCIRAGRRR